jgi:hypothetical protein
MQVVTFLVDKNRFPVHNVDVVGPALQTRLLYSQVLGPSFGISLLSGHAILNLFSLGNQIDSPK